MGVCHVLSVQELWLSSPRHLHLHILVWEIKALGEGVAHASLSSAMWLRPGLLTARLPLSSHPAFQQGGVALALPKTPNPVEQATPFS